MRQLNHRVCSMPMNLVLIKVLLVTTILSIPLSSFSQENIIQLVSNTPLLKKEDNNFLKSKLCGYNNMRLYTSETVTGKTKEFYYYNTLNGQIDLLKIQLNKKNKVFFYDRILSMGLLNNQLLLLTNNHILLYQITDKNELFLIQVEKNNDNYSVCKNLGDHFFLYVNYRFHPLDAKHQHIWAIYDLTTHKINKQQIMPTIDIDYTFFVNSWVDTYKNNVVYAHSSAYKIYFYNQSFIKIDSIVPINSNLVKTQESNDQQLNSRDGISFFRKFDDSLNTRIRKVFYVNDTSILVLIKLKNSDSLQLDLWIKKNNLWELKKNNKYTIWFNQNEEYTTNNIKTLTDLYQNINDIYLNNQGEFEIWYYPFFENIICKSFDSDLHYFSIQNKIILNHETKIGIKHFRVNCN